MDSYANIIAAAGIALVMGWILRGLYVRWKANEPARTAELAKKYVTRLETMKPQGMSADEAAAIARFRHLLGDVKTEAAKLPDAPKAEA